MRFFFLLFIPVANYNALPWRNATKNEKNLIFKISQTFSILGGGAGACLNEWRHLKDFSKIFF